MTQSEWLEIIPLTFGEDARRARMRRGWERREMARRLDISTRQVRRVETDDCTECAQLTFARRLEKALDRKHLLGLDAETGELRLRWERV